MITTIDKAGRVVIPAAIREQIGLKAGAQLGVSAQEDGSIRLLPKGVGPELVQRAGRWIARPTVAPDEVPAIDFAELVEAERDRSPW
jgi:AbrB family looped-hinge helix DNA binding protein